MASVSTYAFFQSAVQRTASIFCGVRKLLGRPVCSFFRADPVSSEFLIQVFIACFEGTWPWRPKLKKNRRNSPLHLPNYHCFCKNKNFYGEITLFTVPLFHDYWMARLSVAQGSCSAVLPTVHGCHYAFQKFPFFCVTLYIQYNNTRWIISFVMPLIMQFSPASCY